MIHQSRKFKHQFNYDADSVPDTAIIVTRRTALGLRRVVRVYSGATGRIIRHTDTLTPPNTDLNADGLTDAADLALLLQSLGDAADAPAAYDLNADGAITMLDAAAILKNIGAPSGPSNQVGACPGGITCPPPSGGCPPCSGGSGGSGSGSGGGGGGGGGGVGGLGNFGGGDPPNGGGGLTHHTGSNDSGSGSNSNNNNGCTASSQTATATAQFPDWNLLKDALKVAAEATPFVGSLSLGATGEVSVTASETCCTSAPTPPTSPLPKLTYAGNFDVSMGGQFGLPGYTYIFNTGFNVTVPDPFDPNADPIAEISAVGMIEIGPQLVIPAPGGPPLTIGVGVNGALVNCPQEECLTITGNAAFSARVTIGGTANFNVEVVFPGLLQDCPIGTQFSATLEGFVDTGASIQASYNEGCTDANGQPNSGFQGGAIDFDGVNFGIHGSATVHLINPFTISFVLPSPYNVDPKHWTLNP